MSCLSTGLADCMSSYFIHWWLWKALLVVSKLYALFAISFLNPFSCTLISLRAIIFIIMEGKVLLGNVVIATSMQLRPVSSYIRRQLLAGEMVQLPAESDKGSETYNGT